MGIGFEMVCVLVVYGVEVMFVCCDEVKGEVVVDKICKKYLEVKVDVCVFDFVL